MRALVLLLASCHATGTPARPTTTLTCERDIAGLDAHLERGAVLWFGEMHGTVESPRFVVDVACHAARLSRVQLALEVPTAEQPRIDAYLESKGTAFDRTALVQSAFWLVRDGRSSEAMFGLIDRVRTLRASGARIDIFAVDGPALDRDLAMANMVATLRDPDAILVGLSGNVHSRRVKGTSWDPDYVALVAHLVARGLSVTTFNVAYTGGTSWGCASNGPDDPPVCGEHALRSSKPDTGPPWSLGPARDDAHDGVYRVGAVTASPPARPDISRIST